MPRDRSDGDDGNERERLKIVPSGEEREAYWPLLLLADESEPQVRSYYQEGDLYVLADADGTPLGIVLVLPLTAEREVELKAVAVTPERHGQGIGQRMLRLVLADLRARSVRRVVVGTGNSGIGQLAFYQKAGFRLWRIERDFFSPERGYREDIEENGIPLRDMAWMDQDLHSGDAAPTCRLVTMQ
ncbi:MAG TPA: GNAT family N-acetyltransferase [Thermomicrobiales bacterium]|nr:GNAT family N-acetyltransferase [Thermomicrobiales bacterium]